MDLILCWHLQGIWTGIDKNEFNSLLVLDRSLDLEQKEENWPVPQRERQRDIFFSVFLWHDDGNQENEKKECMLDKRGGPGETSQTLCRNILHNVIDCMSHVICMFNQSLLIALTCISVSACMALHSSYMRTCMCMCLSLHIFI